MRAFVRASVSRAAPVALVPREANTGQSWAGGYSMGPDRGKLVEIPPTAGAKRHRWTASDTVGNQEIGRLYFLDVHTWPFSKLA